MIKLARLREYQSDPKDFPRQLKTLEDNTAAAVKKLDGAFLPAFTVTRRESNCRASVGEFVVANTVSSNITVTFPSASPENAGRPIAVMKTSAAFTCAVAVVEGTVAGSVSDLVGTVGRLYLYVSDGLGWWRTD